MMMQNVPPNTMIPKTTNVQLQRVLLISAIALYPFVNMFQGIDFTDFGYSAGNYKFVFTHPESLYTTFFPTYLTNVLGGLVYLMLPNTGLISFKISYVLEIYLMCYLIYKVLIQHFRERSVLISILVSTIYLNYFQFGTLNWINYNDLTALFYLASGISMYYALDRRQSAYLLLAGFLIGINFFVRISNLAGISLASVIIIDYLRNSHRLPRQLMKNLILFGAGVLIGVASVVATMFLLGHVPYFVESFRLLRDFASLTPSHNMIDNLLTYLYDLWQSLIMATYFIAIGLSFLLAARYNRVNNRSILVLVGLIIAFVVVTNDVRLLRKFRELYNVRWLFWQSGVVVLLLLFFLYRTFKNGNRLFTIVLISLFILFMTPMGSGRSLLNVNYGMWLALPLTISIFIDDRLFDSKLFTRSDNSSFLFKVTVLSIITLYSLNGNFHELYRDSSDRAKVIYPIAHDYFKGIYTTRTRAQTIEELMHAVETYTVESDRVLGHEYFAMANYITDRAPYMYNPNPMFFTAEVYRFLYYKARDEHSRFPVILSAKGRFDRQWPESVRYGLKHTDVQHDELLNQMRKIIESLKKDGKYSKIWQNDFFEIWKSGITDDNRGAV